MSKSKNKKAFYTRPLYACSHFLVCQLGLKQLGDTQQALLCPSPWFFSRFPFGIFETLLICSPAPHGTHSANMHTVILLTSQGMEPSLHPGARIKPKPVTLFRNISHKFTPPMDEGDLLQLN